MYKLGKIPFDSTTSSCVILNDNTAIPFDPDNSDYANFKKQINADEAQLLDAGGNLMTAEQAKAFVLTLP